MRDHLMEIYQSALRAVQPQALLPAWVEREGEHIRLGDQSFVRSSIRHLYVVAVGKAAAAMADTLEQVLGDAISEGLVITKEGYGLELQYMRCLEAAHPVPDHRSLEAAYALENLLRHTSDKDLVLVLLSGGASSLVADLVPGVQLDAVMALFHNLLRSGADIREMNTVRKHFSRLKGGQFTRMVYPAQVVCLAISDVIGDSPDVIGSGLTVPDPTTYGDAYTILERYGLLNTLDEGLADWLAKGRRGEVAETPKPGDPVFEKSRFYLVGHNRLALQSAAQRAWELGYSVIMDARPMLGETRDLACELAQELERYAGSRPACVLMGGETTVTVRGEGKGGRNQEFALAMLHYWMERGMGAAQMPSVLCAATDGTDGPTDAAGAFVDASLIDWCSHSAIDPGPFLERNDAYAFFEHSGAHFFTGPTHTNVMDLVIALIP
jgi:hydroxypyruvate reductase